MSRLKCLCGNEISDVSSSSPTEGSLIGRAADERAQKDFLEEVTKFLESIKRENRVSYLRTIFSIDYPVDEMSDAEIIEDIRDLVFSKVCRDICECDSCGRIWAQTSPGQNHYISFKPDGGTFAALLHS